jgi:mevalonate kinase
MIAIGNCAERGLTALRNHDYITIASLMNENFGLRRATYGDTVVGIKNIKAIDIAVAGGMAAKFTGSGGAIVCMRGPTDTDITVGAGQWYAVVSVLLRTVVIKSSNNAGLMPRRRLK